MKNKIRIQSLVSTMNQDVQILVKKMKIQTDSVVINQQTEYEFNGYDINGKSVKEYKVNEIGVGKSRNLALLRSDADVCLMADDDMVYTDDYLDIVQKAYRKYPDADMIIFNVRIHQDGKVMEKVKKNGKVKFYNSLKYGTVTFSFKKNSIHRRNIFFSLLFGGGAKYSNGEDSLFLWECLSKGLKVYSETEIIADVYNDNSTWFEGHNNKFFLDRGALFKALSPRFHKLLIYQFALRKHKQYSEEMSLADSIKLMNKGAMEF